MIKFSSFMGIKFFGCKVACFLMHFKFNSKINNFGILFKPSNLLVKKSHKIVNSQPSRTYTEA